MTNKLTTPPLSGHPAFRGGYRLWTAAHGLDFDAVPAYADGGPSTVTAAGWHVSTSSLCRVSSSPGVIAEDDGKVTLSMWRGDPAAPERHALDGTKYDTQRDANRAAYLAGGLALMVYDNDAARYGLPTA